MSPGQKPILANSSLKEMYWVGVAQWLGHQDKSQDGP